MKKKVFNIIQIGDKSNRLSRLFDIRYLCKYSGDFSANL